MNFEEIYKEIPILLSVNLYYYNYIDNKIISTIKNKCIIYNNADNKFTILADDLYELLITDFKEDIELCASYPNDRIFHNVNTAYQLYNILLFYKDLLFINIYINKDKDYSKVIYDNEGNKSIALDYKIEKIKLNLDKYFDEKKINLLNEMLIELKIVNTLYIQSSYSIYVNDFFNAINNLKNINKYESIIDDINDMIGLKYKNDNSILILVTDFLF